MKPWKPLLSSPWVFASSPLITGSPISGVFLESVNLGCPAPHLAQRLYSWGIHSLQLLRHFVSLCWLLYSLLPTRSIQQSRVVQECASLCPGWWSKSAPGSSSGSRPDALGWETGAAAGAWEGTHRGSSRKEFGKGGARHMIVIHTVLKWSAARGLGEAF